MLRTRIALSARADLLRYDLIVRRGGGRDPAIRVFDRARGYPLLSWRGAVVRHLLESGAIPAELSRAGRHSCDKWFVWHLILAATAARIALDQIGYLGPRLRNIFGNRKLSREPAHSGRADVSPTKWPAHWRDRCMHLPDPQRQIAAVLFDRPGQHLTAKEIHCLLRPVYPNLSQHRILSCLDDLASRRIVQRFEVDLENTFFLVQTQAGLF